MSILLLSKNGGRGGATVVSRSALLGGVTLAMALVSAISLYTGYLFGAQRVPETFSRAWQAEVSTQRQDLEEARRTAEENLNALAVRLGQMQAHVIRLDAVGQRLTRMAGLDKGEFDFEAPPPQGGPESGGEPIAVPDFLNLLSELERQLEDRTQQLAVLESMLMNRNLQAEVVPAGRPIKTGWQSSPFGWRTDPFKGNRQFHGGVDFAGKDGSGVIAVAAGVVTWAGKRSGYGNLVEINHGNGYATRYGHNKEILVRVGDTVKKGQDIATMGSTGRSTGPHVHFEVLLDGRAVNPTRYIQDAG